MKCDIDWRLLNSLNNHVKDISPNLALLGMEYARNAYATNKVYVTWEKVEGKDNRYRIIAKGFTMPFEEYGAGTMAIAGRVGNIVVGEDTWSKEHKQEYHRWGYWTHNGVRYYFIRPKYAMHKTVTYLKNNGESLIKRRFTKL